ncbi:neuropeptide F receptor-like [Rhagoletis pomonella]|uniref:neuropeptide F receptor-like n=1 Tax=Rhagoletis pomonella TaxID=28610 RepID=UPI0017803059|nr:neuropeptide F receptor-like [Rhagoletis pomonella]XP_036326944.1 neuropeptide F receptor-like [Rhagoletis pomonella]
MEIEEQPDINMPTTGETSISNGTPIVGRRKTTTTMPLGSPATLTAVILIFNITSAALTLAAAVTLKTTEAAAAAPGQQSMNSTIGANSNGSAAFISDAHVNTTTSALSASTATADVPLVATTMPYAESGSNSGATSTSANARISGSVGSAVELRDEEQRTDLINNKWVQIIFCLIYATIFVLGIFGNVLVCYVVLHNRAMQTVTNIFITNLALSDILLCVLGVPFTPLYTFMGRWVFGHTLCHLVTFAQGCSIYISTWTLMSIAIDRVFVIVFPFRPRMKLSTCILIIVSIWLFSLLFTMPYGIFMKVVVSEQANIDESLINSTLQPLVVVNDSNIAHSTYVVSSAVTTASAHVLDVTTTSSAASVTEALDDAATYTITTYCEENWPSESIRQVFGFVTSSLQFICPFGVITVCYIWVSIKLTMRGSKPGCRSVQREEADRERKKRTNYMLISMVGVFAISWMPINMVNMMDDFYEKSNEWPYYTFLFFVSHSIAMSSTCYNPFLYAWLNENFRKEFKHVLPCFNPSNHNGMNWRGVRNRSDRNTCGPRLYHGNGCGAGSMDIDDADDNGITQETSLARPKDRLTIVPREPTYGNGSGCGALSPNRGLNSALVHNSHVVDIVMNDKAQHRPRRTTTDDDCISGDEQTVEMRFSETPFVSSDNATGTSTMEASSSNEVGERGCN